MTADNRDIAVSTVHPATEWPPAAYTDPQQRFTTNMSPLAMAQELAALGTTAGRAGMTAPHVRALIAEIEQNAIAASKAAALASVPKALDLVAAAQKDTTDRIIAAVNAAGMGTYLNRARLLQIITTAGMAPLR